MQLRLLGSIALIADGGPGQLPAPRKTRALLGSLAAAGQPTRRDRLCPLFWEVPDDPKGALRWSLSKLRGLLGDAVVADRETAELNLASLKVDFVELREPPNKLDKTPPEELERVFSSAAGDFMQDLDLPNFDDFNAWRIATAEDVRTRLDQICAELVGRALA